MTLFDSVHTHLSNAYIAFSLHLLVYINVVLLSFHFPMCTRLLIASHALSKVTLCHILSNKQKKLLIVKTPSAPECVLFASVVCMDCDDRCTTQEYRFRGWHGA